MRIFLEESSLVGEDDGLDAVAELELLEDVRDVRLDGGVADVELLGDLAVRQAGGDQAKDFSFALAEVVELLRRVGAREAGELLDHALCDGGGEERIADRDGADRRDQLLGRIVLEDEAAGAGL